MGLPDDTQTISSQSSQSSNEQEVSIWVDEMEDQQQKKRKSLNEAVGSISSEGGKFLKKLWCCVGGSITR